ncbi:hypothetical protein LX64_01625 [Chitinophaga skermanii]|uniref:NADAR domain-containing protein n=1 Tax=Chitinophaga skermanii TaxID=331697 RepID=A0A327QR42_9BACT|nr:NADAR family protein [Chitinophaga skermanii]RAJ06498.1 hypothetical protein LX64_01625 [Chitinophaga skermanii]
MYTIEWLKANFNEGKDAEFLFFWGHTPKSPQSIDASCFSQWFPASFTVEGITYKTAEHWMMAEKARLFNDEEMLAEILAADKPAVAKALGRKVKNFDPAKWTAHAYAIVKKGTYHKFQQNEAMKACLLKTGDKILVEASPFDDIWGIGMGKDNPKALHVDTWRGQNLLGFILTEVRDEFRKA